jgi:hypothetical protein
VISATAKERGDGADRGPSAESPGKSRSRGANGSADEEQTHKQAVQTASCFGPQQSDRAPTKGLIAGDAHVE